MSAKMVDITRKEAVYREATAEGRIRLDPETIRRVREGAVEKGDVASISAVAAIAAVKKTSEIVPLAHPIPITHADVELEVGEGEITARVTVKTTAQTGVEMEALTGVTACLLTIWDLVKKYEKDEAGQYPSTEIFGVRVLRKVKEPGEG